MVVGIERRGLNLVLNEVLEYAGKQRARRTG